MIIISQFKDYYDHQIEKYGRDEKVILDRRELPVTGVEKGLTFKLPQDYSHNRNFPDKPDDILYRFLVICGEWYIIKILRKDDNNFWDNFSIVTKEDILENDKIFHSVSRIIGSKDSRSYYRKRSWLKLKEDEDRSYTFDYLNGVYDNSLFEISKEIKRVIFVIKQHDIRFEKVKFYERSPILSKIKGVAGILPPEIIYPKISHFIANKLNEPKEMVEISDKSKIVKAGFDLKTSFRNMWEENYGKFSNYKT